MIRNVIKTLFFFRQDSTHNSRWLFICYMKLTINSSTVYHHRQYTQGLLDGLDALDEEAALARELAETALVGRHGGVVHHSTEGCTVVVGALKVAHEVEGHLAALEEYLLYAELLAQTT